MIQYLIVFVAAVCIGAKYLNVAAMRGESGGQLLRLLPALGYIAVSLSVLYVPSLLVGAVLFLLLTLAFDYALTLGDVYSAARKAVPPTTADLLKRLRFAPWVLSGLVVIYLATAYHSSQRVPLNVPTVTTGAVKSVVTNTEQSDREKLDSLNKLPK